MSDKKRQGKRRFWGRAKGRPLSAHQQNLLETLYPKVSILPEQGWPLSGHKNHVNLELEVGFGGAEHLLHRALSIPDTCFIGVEPFLNGIGKALAGIDEHGLSNIRLYHGDVWDILPIIPDGCVRTVHILYPDPWPKSRHFKRRLVQEDLIAQIYRVLEPGAEFRFASDIPSYVDWALVRILAHGGFDWGAESCEGWLKPYPNWPGTRYEAKALREGRTPHYLSFIKQKP